MTKHEKRIIDYLIDKEIVFINSVMKRMSSCTPNEPHKRYLQDLKELKQKL